MNGDAMIDVVGATIGLKSVTVNTVPSRAQILALINVATQELVVENPMAMHTLFTEALNKVAGVDSWTTMVVPLSVQETIGGLNCEYKSINDYMTYINSTHEDDKPVYTISGDSTIIISVVSNYNLWYVVTPDPYTDVAAEPTLSIPEHYTGGIIKKVMKMLLLAEGMPEGLQALGVTGGRTQ